MSGQIIVIISSLIATPFTIRLLGTENYGAFSLISLLIGYVAIADLGMGQAAVRFGMEAYAKEGVCAEIKVFWTSLLVLLIPMGIAVLCLITTSEWFVSNGLKLPSHLQGEAVWALRIAALGLLAKGITGVLMAAQFIRMRADLYSVINTISAVGQIALVPLVLIWKPGLLSAVTIVTAINVFIGFLNIVVLNRILPEWKMPQIKTQIIYPLFKFGLATSLMTLLGIALYNAEKLLLARLESVVVLAYYSVAFGLSRMLAIFPSVMMAPLLPAFSALQAGKDKEAMQRLYYRSVRGLLLGLIPMALVVSALARPALNLWGGAEFASHSLYPFYILLLGTVFDGISYIPRNLLSAVGRPDMIVRYQAFNILPYLLLAWAGIRWGGAVGAAVAWSFRSVAECIMMFYGVKRSVGVLPGITSERKTDYFISLIALIGAAVYLFWVIAPILLVAGVTAAALLTHLIVLWKSVLTREEKQWVENLLRSNFQVEVQNRFIG